MNERDNHPDSGFAGLTEKQRDVLDLLANNRTTKEIAHALGSSESAVNRRIELLRSRLGGVTRHELARRYREAKSSMALAAAVAVDGGVETAEQKLQLAESGAADDKPGQDDRGPAYALQDSLKIAIEAPWSPPGEPRIVPGVLDGDNAALTRGAAIAIILAGIVASLVLALAAVQAITDALGG